MRYEFPLTIVQTPSWYNYYGGNVTEVFQSSAVHDTSFSEFIVFVAGQCCNSRL